MTKRIIFTIFLVIIGFSTFFIGVLSFRSSNTEVPHEEEVIPCEKCEDTGTVPVKKQRNPLSSLLFPDSSNERGTQKALSDKSAEVLNVWATLKIISGVINVLQSAQVGGSFFVEASINPLQFLAPLDNILNRISDILLWAFGAIIFEKLLLTISGYVVFIIIIPICAIVSIIVLWTCKERFKVGRVVIVSGLICLVITLAVPLSFKVSAFLENRILSNNVGNIMASIQEKNVIAENMENEVTGLVRVGRSIMGYMANVKNLGNAFIEDMINYITMFIFINILIPILTILGLFFFTRYLVKLILKTEP